VKGWSFAISRRWFGYLALVVVFAIGCSLLAMWQLARRDEARAEIDRVETNWESTPRPVADVLPQLDSFDPDQKWIPVILNGEYLTDEQVLARGRPRDGNPGFEVLVPFRLDDGSVFIVDRGWLPVGNTGDTPESVPAAPGGRVTVVARLKAGEPIVPGRSAPAGQIATVHLPDLAERVGEPMYTGAYGLMASEDPAPATAPLQQVKPAPDEGPHLSYAFQWFVFGIMALGALVWAVRQEYRARNSEDPAVVEYEEKRKKRAVKKGPTDAEIEDALLDR
jgi:cytochrome oxidase assembly protein ShyY1